MKKMNHFFIFLSMIFLVHIGDRAFKSVKLDFTEDNIYTLSEGTKAVLKEVITPLRIKLYYSKTAANSGTEGLRTFNSYYSYVRDLLKEYVSHSRNNISIEFIDPRPDTDDEEDAISYGLKKFDLSETQSYFFGLVAINESGGEKVIEFFDPNKKARLEYDLTKIIYTSLNPKKATIGVLSELDVVKEELNPYMAQFMQMQGKNAQSWLIKSAISEFYDVKKVKADTTEILAVDVLVVVHPQNLSKQTVFAIDQYLMKGGKVIFFTDPHSIIAAGNDQSKLSSSPGENTSKLFSHWGIEVPTKKFAGDLSLAGEGRQSQDGPSLRLLPVLNCDTVCSESNEVLTSGLDNMTLVYPGIIQVSKTKGIQSDVLLKTTTLGNVYEADAYELRNPAALLDDFKEGNSSLPLAVRLTGEFSTAFPNGIEIEGKSEKNNSKVSKKLIKPENSVSAKQTSVVIVSDVDMIADQFAFQNTILGPALANDNANFLLNALDIMTGDNALLSIRAKSNLKREFDVINEIERQAEELTEEKVTLINSNIERFQSELDQLANSQNSANIALIQSEGIQKQRELVKKLAALRKELRQVKRVGREQVEEIGMRLHLINLFLIPSILALAGTIFVRRRKHRGQSEFSSEELQKLDEVGGHV